MYVSCNKLRNLTLVLISGVNGDTVDVIFGNISELVKVELELQSCMEEMKVITTSDTLLPVGSVFNHFAKVRNCDYWESYFLTSRRDNRGLSFNF